MKNAFLCSRRRFAALVFGKIVKNIFAAAHRSERPFAPWEIN
jgi:hypothetical protein